MKLLYSHMKVAVQVIANRFGLSHATLWSVVLIALTAFIFVHVEILIAREYAPETLLVRVGNATETTNCSADVSTEDSAYEKAMNEIDSIYQYLDPSVFTVTPDSGYFLLETDLQDFSEDFQIRVRCYNSSNALITDQQYTTERRNRCLVQEKGRLLVC